MVMAASVLATELLNLDPVPTEAQAIQTLADAYAVFAADAVAGAQPITPAGVAAGKAAMIAALPGMNSPGASAMVLATAVQAFWGAAALGLATSFAGATAIVPPPNAGLQALLTSDFSTNTGSSASKAAATSLLANDFYAQSVIGGTVTYPGPIVSPIL
jgi:hypothetical protein